MESCIWNSLDSILLAKCYHVSFALDAEFVAYLCEIILTKKHVNNEFTKF